MSVAGKRIVIFGDSLSASPTSPGGVLGRELTAAGATVKINAKVGRSAWSFYAGENGMQLAEITDWKPDVVIVMLGTNDIGLSMAKDATAMSNLRKSLAIGGVPVWGIGPPAFADGSRAAGAGQVVDMMRPIFAADGFIDWRNLSRDQTTVGRTADQVHFTAPGGEIAGKRLAAQFMSSFDSPGIGIVLAVIAGVLAWSFLR